MPEDKVELNAPSLDGNGVCSDVVSCTLTVKGVVGTPLEARQVAASFNTLLNMAC
jgi:hypothetical protein